MDLKTFLRVTGGSGAQMARDLKKPASTVYGWISGRRRPRLADLAQIERLTEGAVTASDFFNSGAA